LAETNAKAFNTLEVLTGIKSLIVQALVFGVWVSSKLNYVCSSFSTAERVTAVIPCFPYARQDKKDKSRSNRFRKFWLGWLIIILCLDPALQA